MWTRLSCNISLVLFDLLSSLIFREILMKTILSIATALITGLFFNSSAIAEDEKPAEWLFVYAAETTISKTQPT